MNLELERFLENQTEMLGNLTITDSIDIETLTDICEEYHKRKLKLLGIANVRISFSDEKFRELFNELINAGRDMQTRDNLGNSYMSEDMYFKDVKARYSNEA